jgi:hypothetical protein
MNTYNNYGRSSQIKILDLKLQETGTFSQMHHRPYEAVIRNDALETLGRRIEETIHRSTVGRVDQQLVSGMADGLITVSSTPDGTATIANGWETRRFRFVLTVSVSTGFGEEISYFQGYSEFFDVSHGGHVDPNMIFFINSYTRVGRMSDPTSPVGGYIDRVLESRQVMSGAYGPDSSGAAPQSFYAPPAGRSSLYGARPEDLFVGVQYNYLAQGVETPRDAIMDTRTYLHDKAFSNTRNNAIPGSMLSSIINTWRQVETMADYGQGHENIYDRAIQILYEANPMENPFIAALSNIHNSGLVASVTFSLNDLLRIDPTVGQRVFYQPLENHALVHSAGMTASLSGSDKGAQIAYIASQAVAALMQQVGLVTVHFNSTNMTMTNQTVTDMTAPGVLVGSANPIGCYQLFTARFTSEIMPDLTMNNLIPINLSVSADIYNETRIVLSIDCQPPVEYAFPSFADSLLQPTMTCDQANYGSLINGLDSIMQYCGIGGVGGIDSIEYPIHNV